MISNDLVNIWEVALESGQEPPTHHHEFPNVVISLESGLARITEHGTGRQRKGESAKGNAIFDPGGAVHSLQNIGETRSVDRQIEFKTDIRPNIERVAALALSPEADRT